MFKKYLGLQSEYPLCVDSPPPPRHRHPAAVDKQDGAAIQTATAGCGLRHWGLSTECAAALNQQ
jgi:hypothetical protein